LTIDHENQSIAYSYIACKKIITPEKFYISPIPAYNTRRYETRDYIQNTVPVKT